MDERKFPQQKSPEEIAKENFLSLFSLQKYASNIIDACKFGDYNFTLEGEPELKSVQSKNEKILKDFGLVFEYGQKLQGDSLDLDAQIKIEELKKFIDLLSKLPGKIFTINMELQDFSFDLIRDYYEEDIKDFSEGGEISDKLLELRQCSDDLSLQFTRLMDGEDMATYYDIYNFLKSYKDAFTSGYIKELSVFYKNQLLIPAIYEAGEEYEDIFLDEIQETTDEKQIDAFLEDVQEDMEKIIKGALAISLKTYEKPVTKIAMYGIRQSLANHYKRLRQIENPAIIKRYRLIVKEAVEKIRSHKDEFPEIEMIFDLRNL